MTDESQSRDKSDRRTAAPTMIVQWRSCWYDARLFSDSITINTPYGTVCALLMGSIHSRRRGAPRGAGMLERLFQLKAHN
ncbi:MAG: hypothetical protein RSE94_16095, partial [Pseudomonas sp.]